MKFMVVVIIKLNHTIIYLYYYLLTSSLVSTAIVETKIKIVLQNFFYSVKIEETSITAVSTSYCDFERYIIYKKITFKCILT